MKFNEVKQTYISYSKIEYVPTLNLDMPLLLTC